jgi:hypothetical protein
MTISWRLDKVNAGKIVPGVMLGFCTKADITKESLHSEYQMRAMFIVLVTAGLTLKKCKRTISYGP